MKPSSVIVKVFDFEKKRFIDDSLENEVRYSQMASSGAMNKVLIPVTDRNPEKVVLWIKLVSHISNNFFPPKLHSEIPMTPPLDLSPEEITKYYLEEHKSRFEQAFLDTHKGNIESFLAEVQYAFVRAYVHKEDDVATNRWLHLIHSIYNAGKRNIEENSELFPPLINTIITQFNCLSDNYFSPDDEFIRGSMNLIEDMNDIGTKDLQDKAKEFNDYINKRRVKYFKNGIESV
ncbi:hypothetical protein LCGC14_0786760 [marine sediment metagenome]|uniref:AAR2 C-terminal domain-containing protein n=1 Tax=marine sediment metagenome TaxID=412755 RepID=A0A0F9QDL6_9ZZZZ